MNKLPQKALLKSRNKVYPILNIFFHTQQVSLQEKENVLNTVDFKDVVFIED